MTDEIWHKSALVCWPPVHLMLRIYISLYLYLPTQITHMSFSVVLQPDVCICFVSFYYYIHLFIISFTVNPFTPKFKKYILPTPQKRNV